jgi:NitT/TauT family transport system permease protein
MGVPNHTYALPGIGSYVAAAIEQSSLSHVGIAIVVMVFMVIGVNFLFRRPVVAGALPVPLLHRATPEAP